MLRDDLDSNPWLFIEGQDYEAHMADEKVGQTQFLLNVFRHMLEEFRPKRLLVPGCTTGSGFHYIDPKRTTRIVGVDINHDYLRTLEHRYRSMLPQLETICADINRHHFLPGSFDLIHCALLFEYVDVPSTLRRLSGWLDRHGVLVSVIQLPDEHLPMISQTPYKSLEKLSSIMKLVDPEMFNASTRAAGLEMSDTELYELNSGKKFRVSVHRVHRGA